MRTSTNSPHELKRFLRPVIYVHPGQSAAALSLAKHGMQQRRTDTGAAMCVFHPELGNGTRSAGDYAVARELRAEVRKIESRFLAA